jgi:hypothetical protein
MKRSRNEHLVTTLRKAAAREGLDWREHFDRADEAIIFGSHALSVQTPESDIDLLCIGRGKSCSKRTIHILWMSRSRFDEHVRQGSELACHIAAFGVWLKGHRHVPMGVIPSKETIMRRRDKIEARCRALSNYWVALAPSFRMKHVTKIRRDLQRLELLQQGRPNLPAPELDARWSNASDRASIFQRWIQDDAHLEQVVSSAFVDLLRTYCATENKTQNLRTFGTVKTWAEKKAQIANDSWLRT